MFDIGDLHAIAAEMDETIAPIGNEELYLFTAEELVEFTSRAIELADERKASA
jgi:hypothetical protein